MSEYLITNNVYVLVFSEIPLLQNIIRNMDAKLFSTKHPLLLDLTIIHNKKKEVFEIINNFNREPGYVLPNMWKIVISTNSGHYPTLLDDCALILLPLFKKRVSLLASFRR